MSEDIEVQVDTAFHLIKTLAEQLDTLVNSEEYRHMLNERAWERDKRKREARLVAAHALVKPVVGEGC